LVAKANKEWIKNAVVNPVNKINILKLVTRDHKDLKVAHKASKVLRAEEIRTLLADNNVRAVHLEVTWKMKKAQTEVEARVTQVAKVEAKAEAKADNKVTEEVKVETKADLVHQAVSSVSN
jgi:hypothetical protein